jgi:hypothetical protein
VAIGALWRPVLAHLVQQAANAPRRCAPPVPGKIKGKSSSRCRQRPALRAKGKQSRCRQRLALRAKDQKQPLREKKKN